MTRINDHLPKGTPEDIQRLVDEVRDEVTQALMFIHSHLGDSADGRAPEGVDGSYLRDAKDKLTDALIDLTALEAYNDAPPMLTGTLAEFRKEGLTQ
jgi:hypothetical protein